MHYKKRFIGTVQQAKSALLDERAAPGSPVEFALAVARGLSDHPQRLDSRFLYDSHGSYIFERICEQPEYYLTRTEAGILASVAGEVAQETGPVTLIELGSGSSVKTRLLLEAYCENFGTAHYAPVDISRSMLEQAEMELAVALPEVSVQALHGTYETAYPLLGSLSPAMMLFLGSTVGNLDAHEAAIFWKRVSRHLSSGDYCLLGIDINHDDEILNAAYNDAAGYSEAFTRNIFERMNRELGASIDTGAISHEAYYVPKWRRVEIFARFLAAQEINLELLESSFRVESGGLILTEISRKFDLNRIVPYLGTYGLETTDIFTDGLERFAVLLLKRE